MHADAKQGFEGYESPGTMADVAEPLNAARSG